MNKIIITRMDGRILTALISGPRAIQLNLEEESGSVLGNIYIGKVKNIAKNINSAFIDLGGGQTAYYSLTENRSHLFADSLVARIPTEADGNEAGQKDAIRQETVLENAVSRDAPSQNAVRQETGPCARRLRPGDEIVVQVKGDAVKTKDPVVTSSISLTGRYCVVTLGRCHIGFSSKICDGAWKEQIRQALLQEKDRDFGIIVRTNAATASQEEILDELRQLKKRYYRILSDGGRRTCYTLLHRAEPSYIGSLRDTYGDFMEEIVTDQADIFAGIQEYLKTYQPRDLEKVRFYDDPLLSLTKLYSIEKAVEEALLKRVWLKSGGYLVIEPTEAMTVIDVNSGKYAGKKTLSETILKINLEAAAEIAYQLRLRNLSGIIVVDFIDMDRREDRQELMEAFTALCRKDPVKTTVVDMTALGLVEVTRKKIRKSFREQVQKGDKTK